MKKIYTLLLAWLLQIHSANVYSQDLQSLQDQIYQAYISGNMQLWQDALNGLEKLYDRQPQPHILNNLLLAQYGLTGYYLGINEKNLARNILDQAEKNLEKLQGVAGYQSHYYAYQGAFLGFRIGLRPIRAMVLGPKSMRAIDRALQEDPQNPAAHLEKANALFYAPAFAGGSKKEAIGHYQKAMELMQQQQRPGYRWLLLSTMVSLAKAFEETGQISQAFALLQKALDYEPGFSWVRDELLPQLQKKQ